LSHFLSHARRQAGFDDNLVGPPNLADKAGGMAQHHTKTPEPFIMEHQSQMM